jgi:nitrite reductase/ring-hydroxylating ferredoxin subunit
MALSEIREGVLNVKVLKNGKKALVVKHGGEIKVFHEVCPHLGADLSEGWYCEKSNTLRCKWHGYLFSASDGTFLENPNENFMRLIRVASEHFKPEKTPKYRLGVIPSNVRDGRLYIGRDASSRESGSRESGSRESGSRESGSRESGSRESGSRDERNDAKAAVANEGDQP